MNAVMAGQMAVNGLLAGMVYILMALGFTLIFGVMRLVNFAHGEFYMAGAFALYALHVQVGVPFGWALLMVPPLAAALGWGVERVLLRRLAGLELNAMIMTLAVAMALQSVALMVFGPTELNVPRPVSGVWHLGGAIVPLDRALVGGCALLILAGFYLFLKHTRLGLAMQAVAQDADAAALMGVAPVRIHALAFVLAAVLAALAGALMAPIYVISPYMGELPMLKAFIVVIIGGLGSVGGAVLGGLLLGVVESLFATLYSPTVALIASFSVLLIIILVRPHGLLGRAA